MRAYRERCVDRKNKDLSEPKYDPPDISPHVADALDEVILVKGGFPGTPVNEMSVWEFKMRAIASQILGSTMG